MRALRNLLYLILTVVMVFSLYACGGGGGSSTPANQAPAADAGADQAVNEGTVVTLDGSNSLDPEGATLTYLWTQVSGSEVITLSDPTAEMPTFTAPFLTAAESYEFELTVEDDVALTATDRVIISITNSNELPPVADAGPDQTVNGGDPVALDGTGSSDPESLAITYLWTQTAGTNVSLSDATDSQPTFTAPSSVEVLTFNLRVTDAEGLFADDTVDITIAPLFADDFSTDTTGSYMLTNLNSSFPIPDPSAPAPQFNHDGVNLRGEFLTGDNSAGSISLNNAVSPIDSGTFSVDFAPTVTHPSAGRVLIRLKEDADNYYEISNDSTGSSGLPGFLRKVVGGNQVDIISLTNTGFTSDSSGNTVFTIVIDFSPSQTSVNAFGEVKSINTNLDAIQVNNFDIELRQQDAFIDNIVLF